MVLAVVAATGAAPVWGEEVVIVSSCFLEQLHQATRATGKKCFYAHRMVV